MLIFINYIAIAVIGGTYYLLAERFASETPFAVGLIVALLAGLLMVVVNHLALKRQFGAREDSMTFHDWNHRVLVFVVTVSVMLSLGQLVLTRQLPEPRPGPHLFMLALFLLMIGLTAYTRGPRSRPEQNEPSRDTTI
ncbi:MAG: hypothetical protein ROY82_08715 [Truepera sp.]|nr:hypothetical protein [Truepera sp.]